MARYERALVRVFDTSTLAVAQKPPVVLVGDPVHAIMMHDFFWLKKQLNRANNDVLRLSPSRLGFNSRDPMYRGSQLYGYELIGDMTYVEEYLYDNDNHYFWSRTTQENIALRYPGIELGS